MTTTLATPRNLFLLLATCSMIGCVDVDETSELQAMVGSGSGSGSGSASGTTGSGSGTPPANSPAGTPPTTPGVDTASQVIFEHAGWPAYGGLGTYRPGLTTAAELVTACAGVPGNRAPIRVGGHSSQVLTLLGCDLNSATPTIDPRVATCFRTIGGATPTIVMDGCGLANAPQNRCVTALTSQGFAVVAANVCVQTAANGYSVLSTPGSWITFPAATPPPAPAPLSCTCDVVNTRACTPGATLLGYRLYADTEAANNNFIVTPTTTCAALNEQRTRNVRAHSYSGQVVSEEACQTVYRRCQPTNAPN